METVKLIEGQEITGQINRIPTKVYIVSAQDDCEYSDGSWDVAVFGTEAEAKKYCEVHDKLEEDGCGYKYFYRETEIEHFNLNTEVKPYYEFSFDTDFKTPAELIDAGLIDTSITTPGYIESMCFKLNHPDEHWCNTDDTYNRIYDEDLHIKESDYGDYKHYEVYSINSYEEARSTGLKMWEEFYEKFKTDAIK